MNYGYILLFFFLPKLMIHLYSSIGKAACHEKKSNYIITIFPKTIRICYSKKLCFMDICLESEKPPPANYPRQT